MKHPHDLDLIDALARDALDDPTEARALVASCDVCADAYRDHLAVLAAFDQAGSPQLTDLERRRLRNEIWDSLEADRANERPVSTDPPGVPWWRLGQVAAALVVVVGVGAVLSNGLGSGDSGETAFEATSEALQTAEAPMADSDGGTDAADDATMADAAESTSDTTDTATEETFAEDLAGNGDGASPLFFEDAAEVDRYLDGVLESTSEFTTFLDEQARVGDASVEEPNCTPLPGEEPPDEPGTLIGAAPAFLGDRELIISLYDTETEIVALAIASVGCELIATSTD